VKNFKVSNLLGIIGLLAVTLMLFVSNFPTASAELAHLVPAVGSFYDAHVALLVAGSSIVACLPIAAIVEEDDCGSNPGGTNELYVARKRDVESIPAPGADKVTISTPIVMKPGKAFVKWDHAQDTGDINHKSEGDPGNKSVSTDVNCYVPKGNPAIDSVVQSALNGEFIVIVVDGKGQQRIGGDLLRGLIFDHDYKSGKKGTDKNGSDFKFATTGMGHVPFYYTAAIPLVAAPVA
jgi:hypothetical protein